MVFSVFCEPPFRGRMKGLIEIGTLDCEPTLSIRETP
jgi:hypothetical protein